MDIFLELKKAGLLDKDNIVDRQTVVDLLSIINNTDMTDQVCTEREERMVDSIRIMHLRRFLALLWSGGVISQ